LHLRKNASGFARSAAEQQPEHAGAQYSICRKPGLIYQVWQKINH